MSAQFQSSLAGAQSFAHQYVRIDGQRIHCVTAGAGTPVLLIPGWPQTWYAWRHVMQALAARGFMAIAVDPPGTGYSDRPEAGYDTGRTAAALHRVMAQLGFDVYQVAGHDVGMWVAYALASDRPEAVKSLALTEAVIPGLAPAPSIFAPPEENIFLWHFMFNQLADLPETLIAGRERAYLEFMFNRWSFRRDCVAVDVYIDAYSAPGGLRGGFSYYRAIPETIRQNQARAQRKLAMPVLAIGAEHATGDAPLVTMRDNATDLQGAVVPDCGHFIMEEAPDAFIGHLLPFLERSR
ncbi:TPA: alpha/beta hydrolase [Burkholderia aenigmatica]|uniref:alpha/beta fold hydrolase n=1 Tax=Burkholderia sp. AU45251 TaxID=3059204 RepID=UPI002650C5EF|nr:alpha/beta hydrolase [Burkholderia sp. AU45251]HDR9484644.1 alpha/beta hydrolase [Burkholderia aenigmatica]MDN7516757.1 alpha/beta hydrolase [Burkholderia sp. AU45251]HDR9515920.1 alpha/beta hydrolase [Burkholderia aenigmatica]HDR9592729.1 alpha/beta hydrolase [Burkholderia aenigmatica]HDR9599709.1 alpha/beta hydrolase [Burkholderia aenigmatica]